MQLKRIIVGVFILLLFFSACLPVWILCNSFKPITPSMIDGHFLETLARARTTNGQLVNHNKPERYDLSSIQVSAVITSLLPIRHKSVGAIPSDRISYTLHFQAGKNPAEFKILLEEESICFEFNGHIYDGGESQNFNALMETLDSPYPTRTLTLPR